MRKLFSTLVLCLCCASLLILSGCSCNGKGGSHSNTTMSWQENYDLGIRLLSEGNYEEAILAFQAAIQIDPKRAEAYLYLADAYISAGDYDAATDLLLSGMDQAGYLPEFDRQLHYIEFLQSEGTGVHILDVEFDRNSYLAKNETLFTVTVAYRCPDSTESYLALGDNCEAEAPNIFLFPGDPFIVTGEGTTTMSCSLIPIQPYGFPFGLAVNLSPTDGSGDAFDLVYFDEKGNITYAPDFESDEFDPGNFDSEVEHPLVTLFAADPDAGLTIEELTLFGTPIKGLSLEDAVAIAQQNGFPGRTTTEGDYTTFSAFYQDDTYPHLSVSRQYPSATPTVEYISYVHFLTQDDNGKQMRREDSTPVWVGIRSIHTYDTLEQVLSALGYSKSHEIAAQIHDIFQLPEAEARIQLENLWQWGWCCNTNGISHSLDTGLVDGWDFSWYGFDPETETSYTVRFTFDVATDCLTDVYISVY